MPGVVRRAVAREPTAAAAQLPPWQELNTYRAAMLASAVGDLATLDRPTLYHIVARLTLDDGGPSISAVQDTRYTNRSESALSSIFFRLFPNKPSYGSELTFRRVTVDGMEANLEFQQERTAVGVNLPQALQAGQAVTVHMEYNVTVPVANARGYGTFNSQDGVLLLSNFFAIAAVWEGRGWNLSLAPDYGDPVFAETSLCFLELTVPQIMTVVTSGSTTGKRENQDGTMTWTCVSGPMRDMMVVTSDRFTSSSTAVGFIRVNSYYLPENKEAGEAILGYARDALRAYQQSFGNYPFAELDVVAAPISAGGMEYPGLVMIAEPYYKTGGEYFEFVAAHEVAHQWWYGLVGSDQVNEPWLDESLTNFSTVYYYENTYDRGRADLVFKNYVQSRYQVARDHDRDAAVNQPVAAFSPEDYGYIVYGKGAVFFYRLREKLGDEAMLAFLRAYLQDRKYKLSTSADLLRLAEDTGGQDVTDLYQDWVLSAHTKL